MAEESAPKLVPLTNPRRHRLTPGSLAAKEAEQLLGPPELLLKPDPRVGRRPAVVGTGPDNADAEGAPAPRVRRRGVIPADAGGPPRKRFQAKD